MSPLNPDVCGYCLEPVPEPWDWMDDAGYPMHEACWTAFDCEAYAEAEERLVNLARETTYDLVDAYNVERTTVPAEEDK